VLLRKKGKKKIKRKHCALPGILKNSLENSAPKDALKMILILVFDRISQKN